MKQLLELEKTAVQIVTCHIAALSENDKKNIDQDLVKKHAIASVMFFEQFTDCKPGKLQPLIDIIKNMEVPNASYPDLQIKIKNATSNGSGEAKNDSTAVKEMTEERHAELRKQINNINQEFKACNRSFAGFVEGHDKKEMYIHANASDAFLDDIMKGIITKMK